MSEKNRYTIVTVRVEEVNDPSGFLEAQETTLKPVNDLNIFLEPTSDTIEGEKIDN